MLRVRALIAFAVAFLTLSLWAFPSSAVTFVGGAITANTTWTAANSPYEVTSEVLVYNNARLTIEPGVTVSFNSGTGLVIGYYVYGQSQANGQERGALTVNGTAANPVLFTSKSGASGGWKGLSFGDATDHGGLASVLNYLTVEKAGQPQNLGGSIGATSANIMAFNTGTTFTWNNVQANGGSGYGFYFSGSTFSTTSSKAQNNGNVGLYATGSTLSASGMTISGNTGNGVFLQNTGGTLSASTISNNTGFGIDTTGGSPTLSTNTISANGNYGIRYIIGNAPIITGNTLSANANAGVEVVGGALTSNHTWNLQNGETAFTVTGAEIVVHNLAVLTVAAGVTTRFATGTGLIIGYYVYNQSQANGTERGKLVVNGTAGNRVLFTAQNGQPGGWKGLAFGDATDYDRLASSINNLTVEKAGQLQNLGGSIAAVSANIMMFNTGTTFTWTGVEANNGSGNGFYISGSTFTATGGGGSQNADYNLRTLGGSNGTVSSAVYQTSGTGGLLIDASSPTFSGCTIQNNQGAGVYIKGGSTPTVTGGSIKNNRGYAVYTEDLASVSAVNNIAFDGNGKGSDNTAGTGDDTYVGRVSARSAVKLNTFANTSKPGIELVGGPVTSNFQWFLPGAGDYQHYVLLHELVVYNTARLTVDAGVTTKFAPGTGLIIGYYVYDQSQANGVERGQLNVNGTAGAPVLFTALNDQPGGWRGVAFGSASDYSPMTVSLNYLTVDRAGEPQNLGGSVGAVQAGIMMFNTGTTFSIDHVGVTNSSAHGFYTSGSTFTSTFSEAQDNAGIGVYAISTSITMQGAAVSGNGGNGIQLTNTNGIVTTSAISDNANYGIDTTGGSPTLSSNTISNNDNYAIRYIIGNAPVISGNTLSGNFNPGVEVVGGALTTNHTWSYQNGEPYFSITGAEILVYNLAVLTVGAGVTSKFSTGTGLVIGYYVYNQSQANGIERGRLVVNGTAANRAVFTAKNGQAGGWKGLSFGDATDYGGLVSTISYLTVERGGQAQNLGGSIGAVSANIMLFNTGTTFTFTGVEANYGSGVGVYVSGSTLPWSGGGAKGNASWNLSMVGGSNGTVSSATFDASNTGGARIDGSSPTLSSCAVTNNLGTGIHLRSGATPTVTGGSIGNNRGYGVFTEDLGSRATFQNIAVSNNGKGADGTPGTADDTYVMRVAATSAVKTNTFAGNGKQGIEMVGGPVTANFQWFLPGTGDYQHYILLNETLVYNFSRLTVDAGVTTKFAPGTGLIIGYYVYNQSQANGVERGAMTVNGTAQNPVLFTSLTGESGGWRGLSFGDASDYGGLTCTLANLTVEKAGEPQNLGGSVGAVSANLMMFNTGTTFTMTNVSANAGSGYGVYTSGSTFTTTGGGASNNGSHGLYAYQSQVTVQGGSFKSNANNGIFLSQTGGLVTGSTIQSNTNYGIDESGGAPSISSNNISYNGKYAVRYPIGDGPIISSNTLTANVKPGIEVLGGALTKNHTWSAQIGEPVFSVHNAELVVYNLAVLTVGQGVTVRFAPGTGLVVGYYVYNQSQANGIERGKLVVNGTGTAPVLFTAENNAVGGWKGVSFGDATDYGGLLSTLTRLIIEKAGQAQNLGGSIGAVSAGLMMFNTTLTANNLDVVQSAGAGIYSSGSAPTVKNTIVAYNSGAGLVAVSGGTPAFTYGNVYSNGQGNIGWTAGTGSKTQDPLFYDVAQGDYRLQLGSPMVDTGVIVSGVAYTGTAPDMGAIELGIQGCAPGVPNGIPCEDGELCTTGDTCQNGACVGAPVVCGGGNQNQCVAAAACNPANGLCEGGAPLANGTACNDGNACTQSDSCQAGSCVGTDPITCVASDQCHAAGTCNPASGVCSNPSAPNGTACNDGNLCTLADACYQGVCGGSPKVCAGSGACFTGGSCDIITGECVSSPVANGTACSDGNACTQTDTCQNGTCNGSNPKTCNAPGQCQGSGTCNPVSGSCSYPALANGTACNDGNACTQTDTCQSGSCSGGNPKVCPTSGPCLSGVCAPADGSCSEVQKPNGTSCTDGSLCTTGDVCQPGQCQGNAVVCGETDCAEAGSCDLNTGACVRTPKADGLACDDGDACTTGDTCLAGTCESSNTITCPPPGPCQLAASCNASTGECTYTNKPNGTACDDGDVCSSASACQSGQCVATAGGTDTDDDTVCDQVDNCPTVENPSQTDSDNDGVGDACEAQCVTIVRGGVGNVEDAFLSGDYPTWVTGVSFGSWTGLSGGGNINRSLWKFDLTSIPVGSTVTSATMGVYVSWNANYNLVTVHKVLVPWAENTVSGQSFGGTSGWDFTALGNFQGGGVGMKTIDLTTLAAQWVLGTTPNHGVLFDEPPIENHYYFTSEAGAANLRPKLDICYIAGAAFGSFENPAESCESLAEAYPERPTGAYWLKLEDDVEPEQVNCTTPSLDRVNNAARR
ncbi:MAG: right-handed parallel beta-helix repeat-containing protein [Polyangiaceae bacterium]|nr:right-handed parallel beta-helix repeat-containing protein [Polyangiaceae bacterium]